MSYILRIVLCVCVLFFIACSGDGAKESSGDFSKLDLRVASDASYPPFAYIENGNEVVGFEIDLLKEISSIVGFKYSIVITPFDGIIPAIKSGKVDMAVASMSATKDRAKAVSFSNPYYEGVSVFIKRRDGEDYNENNLSGKRIGVYLGTVQDIYATDLATKDSSINVIRSNDIFGAIMNLKGKKVDIVLSDKATAKGYLKENTDLEIFGEAPDGSEGLSVVFDKDKHKELIEAINKALKDLKDNGKYDELLKKYDLN